jgi:ADP-ribose pyrophosphatase YjhB (NUDIX family)
VRNGSGALLLVQRADTLHWELPGGKVEIGESAAQAVVREVKRNPACESGRSDCPVCTPTPAT